MGPTSERIFIAEDEFLIAVSLDLVIVGNRHDIRRFIFPPIKRVEVAPN